MVKRKNDESAYEYRKRKKKEKFRKEHRYDSEKQYWKNASKQATREQSKAIEGLFAGGGASSSGAAAYNAGKGVLNTLWEGRAMLPAVEEALGAEVMADLLVPAALSAPIAGGAVAVGAAAGYLAGEVVSSLFTQTNSEVLNILSMPGTYQGKIALSAKSAFKGLRDKYQKKGGVYIVENYGSVADPDSVYIGHTTFNLQTVAWSIGIALLRKLFRVGVKCDVSTPYEELPLVSATPDSGPDGYTVIYETQDSDGTIDRVSHTIPNDASLSTILLQNIAGFILYDNIVTTMTLQNPTVLNKVYLYQRNSGSEFRLMYMMDMTKEILSIAMSSHMTIQNRTKSAAGASDTTQVDAQPLKGPVFEFSTGIPKLKSGSPAVMNYIPLAGLILVRAGQLAGSDVLAYREPPVKSAYQNVIKSAYARLNPGAIKSMTIGTDCKGYYGNVLHKLKLDSDNSNYSRVYGKSQMAIFEEELNSGSANNITLTYECQHIAGAEFTTTYSSNLQPGYAQAVINNVPA